MFTKNQSREKELLKSVATDRLANVVAHILIKLQFLFVRKMNGMCKGLTVQQLKKGLFLFCMTTCSYCFYLIATHVFRSQPSAIKSMAAPLQIPVNINPTDNVQTQRNRSIDSQTLSSISQFRYYLDSLKKFQSLEYDSILQARPGLMDSMQMLEQFYYLPIKK
jgi:hypothetical protein